MKYVIDVFDMGKDELMYFGRKGRKGDGVVDDEVVGNGVVDYGVVGVGFVMVVLGFCLFVVL